MITKRGQAILYTKQENYNVIRITMGKKGKITVDWYTSNKIYCINYGNNIRKKGKKLSSELKINGCAICGYNKCNDALEFHHVNPKDKKFRLSTTNLRSNSKDIAEELNKCILLCCRCHKEIHAKERKK